MTDITFLGNDDTTERLVVGKVSKIDGAYVYVTLPSFERGSEFGPIKFEQSGVDIGDSVLVGFDEQATAWIIGWAGSAPAAVDMATQAELDAVEDAAVLDGDAAGGDLTGTYPNPTIESGVGLTGVPTAPTAAGGTSTTQIATTAFVGAAISTVQTDLDAAEADIVAIEADIVTIEAAIDQGALVPIGTVFPFVGAAAPTGYLLADGTSYLRATYPDLFTVLGGASSPYGLPDGTHFNVPDLRGRVPVGADGSAGRLSANDALGNVGGAQTHLLTAAESGLPDHAHTVPLNMTTPTLAWTITGAGSAAYGIAGSVASGGTGSAGSAASAHNNMQPYQVFSYIIRAL